MFNLFPKKRNFLLALFIFICFSPDFSRSGIIDSTLYSGKHTLYDQLQLSESGLSQDIFDKAIKGWQILFNKHFIEKPRFLSIADLSQSSNSKRLYVIDLDKKKIAFNTYVAHGRNSGEEFASSFSNEPDSYKSSLGFYLTGDIYQGSHGLSMKLEGIEKGINDIAARRGIVMHGASYVSDSFVCQYGRLGRSQGCPAVPEELCKPIINSIKGGSCFFMFYPDSSYIKKSIIL